VTGLRRILLVDDERASHAVLRRTLGNEFAIDSAYDGHAALGVLAGPTLPDLVLLDVHLPDVGGYEILARIRSTHPQLPVIVITAATSVDGAIRATALAARDYLPKPLDVTRLRRVLGDVFAAAPGWPPERGIPVGAAATLVGSSPPMQELFKTVGRAARSAATVLITGESGTGKELIARAIHTYSERHAGPLIAINCAAIPDALLESELFGYARGAFTGAENARSGKFELANGGTIVLDEIADLAPALQAKLLRVLEERAVTPLGAPAPIAVDTRIIAITNANLAERVSARSFRADLFYRLDVLRIEVPPLRHRGTDVALLARHFLGRERSRLQRSPLGLTPEAERRLHAHAWPGNVRELENVIVQCCVRALGDRIGAADLPIGLGDDGALAIDPQGAIDAELERLLQRFPGDALERLERLVVAKALSLTGGNQVRAAKLLGTTRNVVRHRIAKYSI
jgi:two-component system response regulator HydG